MQNFEQLELRPTTLHALKALGFTTPTPVQALAIPELLSGADLIAQARTGTGKTAAFGIPLVERLGGLPLRGAVGLVLVPTRELALQVTEQLQKLSLGTRLRVAAIYGGVGFGGQRNALSTHDPVLVVATPGRLLDHVERGTLRLDGVRMLVLDEADRMLDMGFLPSIERIVKLTPRERQTALFSATVPEPIRKLSLRFLRNPKTVRVENGPVTTTTAEQFRVDLQRSQKASGLLALLKKEDPECAIVFTRTKHLARRLAQQLHRAGYAAVALQGNMTQGQRERAMESFRDGEARILVATDIASRGLDVENVSHVVNFDVPAEPEAYVHRVGRTARMGRAGRAFTFVQGDQRRELAAIERTAGVTLQGYDLGELPPAPEAPRPTGDARQGHRFGSRPGGGRAGEHQRRPGEGRSHEGRRDHRKPRFDGRRRDGERDHRDADFTRGNSWR